MADSNLNKQRRRRKNITKASKQSKFLSYGGNLRILQKKECEDIHAAVLDILSNIGIAMPVVKLKKLLSIMELSLKMEDYTFPRHLLKTQLVLFLDQLYYMVKNLRTTFKSLVAKSILVLAALRQQFWTIKQISSAKRH